MGAQASLSVPNRAEAEPKPVPQPNPCHVAVAGTSQPGCGGRGRWQAAGQAEAAQGAWEAKAEPFRGTSSFLSQVHAIKSTSLLAFL